MNRRAWLRVVRNSLIADLEYRVNYAILLLSTFITLAMELAVFDVFYGTKDEIHGMPRNHVLGFVLLGCFVRYGSTLWMPVQEAIDEIRDGSFRRYLLQPVSYAGYFMAKALGPKLPTWTLSTLTIIGFKLFAPHLPLLAAGAVPQFLLAMAFSIAIVWQIYLMFVYLGFWIEEASFLSTAFNLGIGLFSGTTLPLAWLPEGLQAALFYTPLPVVGDFPVRAGLNLLHEGELLSYVARGVIWLTGLAVFNMALKTRAYRNYEAYGG